MDKELSFRVNSEILNSVIKTLTTFMFPFVFIYKIEVTETLNYCLPNQKAFQNYILCFTMVRTSV